MKRLILINGTMGAGKTAVSQELLKLLGRSVWLDGDWCWNMDPFVVTDETKAMVLDNIAHLLRNFLSCSEYDNVIFCWVMQAKSIIDSLLEKLNGTEYELHIFTLMITPQALTDRIRKDMENHIRTPDVLERSLQRLPLYEDMDTEKIDVSTVTARQAAEWIACEVVRSTASEKPQLVPPDVHSTVEPRLSFNKDAVLYDRWRPTYPAQLFSDILHYAQLRSNAKVLEIGIGTGQATEPFLKAGCRVTAVEIGKNLAEYAGQKFRPYPNLSIKNLPFENFNQQPGSFDLVYSATAFHWIQKEIGFSKALNLLKNGATLALWWNRPHPGKPGEKLYQEIQECYKKYLPGSKKTSGDDSARFQNIKATIRSFGFVNLEFHLYHASRIFDAEGYIQLLNTYSDHINIAPDIKYKFEDGIKCAIQKHGNRLTVYDTVDLYLAQKP